MSKKIELPRHLGNVIDELNAKVNATATEIGNVTKEITAHLESVFYANGGCKTCRGRGWIVTWDTMDMMDGSCAEYGACTNPECTKETRERSGLHPRRTKYDSLRGVKDPLIELINLTHRHLLDSYSSMRSELSSLEWNRKRFLKGDKVIVTKGRKVTPGTSGVIAYLSNDGSALIKDEAIWQDRKANGTWVYTSNIEKLV